MNQITREKIIKTVQEVTEEISENTAVEFLESLVEYTKNMSDDLKNNPMLYHQFAVAFAQGNAALMTQEILCRLFCDETA